MKKKSFWENLKGKAVRPAFTKVSAGKVFGDGGDKIRQQFIELSRLGNNPIVMQMGN